MSYVYSLDSGFAGKNELGNKGANLVTMTNLGLPVPPGFVVSIQAFKKWVEDGSIPEKEIRKP